MLISKTLRLFLDGLGRREEYEHYLKVFQAQEGGCFAALAPDLPSLEQSADLVAFDLSFLLKLELFPAVLLCGPSAEDMSRLLEGHSDEVHTAALSLAEDPKKVISDARAVKKIPVLVYPDASLQEVVVSLVPACFRRIHLLRAQGAMKDEEGDPIGYYWLKGRNRSKPSEKENDVLDIAAHCLDAHPNLHFAVGSPLNLLEELFTVVGAGSVIRRGSAICHHASSRDVDSEALLGLLGEAFGKPLADTSFLERVEQLYLEQAYRGAALLESHEAGQYLTKFAVGMQARGEGLALELWNAIIEDHPALFWRSKVGNPINAWYSKQADGRQKIGDWQIYWRGIEPADISSIIDFAATRPEDFEASV